MSISDFVISFVLSFWSWRRATDIHYDSTTDNKTCRGSGCDGLLSRHWCPRTTDQLGTWWRVTNGQSISNFAKRGSQDTCKLEADVLKYIWNSLILFDICIYIYIYVSVKPRMTFLLANAKQTWLYVAFGRLLYPLDFVLSRISDRKMREITSVVQWMRLGILKPVANWLWDVSGPAVTSSYRASWL